MLQRLQIAHAQVKAVNEIKRIYCLEERKSLKKNIKYYNEFNIRIIQNGHCNYEFGKK